MVENELQILVTLFLMQLYVALESYQLLGQVLITISKAYNRRGRLPQHDPAKNKLHSEVAQVVNAAMEANLEKKLCTYTGASNVLTTGTVVSLTANLVRGDASVNECTGILIKPKKLMLALTFSTTVTYNTIRFIVFRWKDASSPLPSGILQTTGNAYAPLSPLSWVNHKKIQVLYDCQDVLYDHGSTISAKTYRVMINPGKLPIQLPLSGAGATPQMDGLYLLLVSDDGLAPSPVVDVYTALTYTDA